MFSVDEIKKKRFTQVYKTMIKDEAIENIIEIKQGGYFYGVSSTAGPFGC